MRGNDRIGRCREMVTFIGLHLCYLCKEPEFFTDLCFLDFLSGFAYNTMELIWITIATLGR